MKLRRVIVAGITALLIPLGGVLAACGGGDSDNDDYVTATVAEDCDYPDDQANREDDCGYWRSPDDTEHRMGSQPASDWVWVWYSWVIVGRTSTPPLGWKAPYGLRLPTKTVRVNKRNCALGLAPGPAAPRPAPAAPRPPAANNAPKAPNGQPIQQNRNRNQNQPPVYEPAGKVAC